MASASPVTILTSTPSAAVAMVALASFRGGSKGAARQDTAKGHLPRSEATPKEPKAPCANSLTPLSDVRLHLRGLARQLQDHLRRYPLVHLERRSVPQSLTVACGYRLPTGFERLEVGHLKAVQRFVVLSGRENRPDRWCIVNPAARRQCGASR